MKRTWYHHAALLSIPFFAGIIAILSVTGSSTVFEPPFLLPVMNTVFLGIIPLFISGIAYRTYRTQGTPGILMLGSGMLIFGLGSIAAGWLNTFPGGANATPTIHNTSVCIGAIFSLGAIILGQYGYYPEGKARSPYLPPFLYCTLAAFTALFSYATVAGLVPPFFIPGSGPTVVRQIVLASAVELYAIAAVMFLILHVRRREEFFFWFSMAFSLISLGLLAVFVQPAVGSLIGWAGRSSQYAGAVFALVAVITARREADSEGITLTDRFSRFFAGGDATPAILGAVKESILLVGVDGTVRAVNRTALDRLGLKDERDLIGHPFDMVVPAEIAQERRKRIEEVIRTRKPVQFEDERNGIILDNSLYPVFDRNGNVTGIAVFSRDITGRRRSEEALQAARSRTDAILHQITDTFYSLDDQWRFTTVNPAAEAAPFGRPAKELLGNVIWDLYPGLAGTRIQQHYFDALKNRSLEHYEAQSPLNLRWYEVFMQGRSGGVDVYMRDITARKEAEGVIRETLHRLNALVSGMQIGILLEWDGKVELVNRTFCDYFRLEEQPEDLIGLTSGEMLKRIGPAYLRPAEEVQRIYGITGAGSRVTGEEIAMREGGMFLRDFIPLVMDDTVRGHLWYYLDITGRKRAEEALRESENRYRDLVQTANSAILQWDRNGTVSFINEYGLKFFGYTKEEIIGSDVRILLPDGGSPDSDSRLTDRVLADPGQYSQNINENVCRDGRRVWVAWTNKPITDANGSVTGILAVGTDITEQKIAEEALRHAYERYDLVLKGAGAGIWDWDVANHRVVYSKQWKAMRGYAEDEVSDSEDEWSRGIHPDDHPRVMAAVQDYLSGKTPAFAEEYRVRKKDGTWIWILDSGTAHRDGTGRVVRMAGSETEITGRKQAEMALKESELRYRTVARYTLDWEFWFDPEGKFLYMSPSAERILGIPVEAFSEAEPFYRAVTHPDDLAKRLAHLQDEMAGKGPYENIEFRIVRPDGEVRWIHHVCRPIYDEQGTFLGTRGSNRDITDRRAAEEALRESEARFRSVIESSRDVIYRFNIQAGKYEYVSPAAAAVMGYSPEELMALDGAGAAALIHPDDISAFRDLLVRLESEGIADAEYRQRAKDGSYRWLSNRMSLIRDSTGIPLYRTGNLRDISERKAAEKTLREQEERLQLSLDVSRMGTWDLDLVRHTAIRSLRHDQIFGYETLLPDWTYEMFLDHVVPEDRADVARKFQEAVDNRREWNFTCRITRKDGEMRWIHAQGKGAYDEGEKPVRMIGIVQDITERKEGETSLQRGMEKLSLLAESSRLLLSSEAPESIVQRICERFSAFLDCQFFFNYLIEGNAGSMRLNAYAGIPEKTAEEIRFLDFGVAVCGCVGRDGVRIIAEDIQNSTEDRTALVRSFGVRAYACHPLIYNGKTLGTLSFGTRNRQRFTEDETDLMRTVTDLVATAMARKRAEDELQRSELDLRQAQELMDTITLSTGVLIAAEDIESRYTYFNKAYADEIRNITGREIHTGMSITELPAEGPEGSVVSLNRWRKVLSGRSVKETISLDDAGGTKKILSVTCAPLRDDTGRIIGAGEVSYDVTRQIRTEAELRKTSGYLENLLDYANAPIIVWDSAFRITRFNHAFERLTGLTAAEAIGGSLDMLFPAQFRPVAMDLIRRATTGDRWEAVEIPIIHTSGEVRTVLWNSAAIREAGTIVSTIAQGQDITDRKRAENQILLEKDRGEEALSLLNAALEATADGIYVVDTAEKITSHNQNFAALWKIPPGVLGTRDDRLISGLMQSQVQDPVSFLSRLQEIRQRPDQESFDTIQLLDGRILERHSKPQRLRGEITGRVFSFRDITARHKAENTLVASNREKEILLREIHHRVKNNLQIISGLLDMTRMRTQDTQTNSILTDMMLKIKTMAQIHTRLYESKQFGMINMTNQVRDQVADLSMIFGSSGAEITSEFASQDILLPVDQAIPFALIVNESLSNAFKHAFRGRSSGTVNISLVQNNGNVRISIRDDGIGLPRGLVVSQANTLGLKLMRSLVLQLRGTMSITGQNGTEVVVEFPLQTEVV